MLAAAVQSPLSSPQLIQRPKSIRKPLQPKNPPATPITNLIPKPDYPVKCIHNSNKENFNPIYSSTPVKDDYIQIESFGSSLAEELGAIREKMERLRIDKEKTDQVLRERGMMLDLQMKDIISRGEAQKQLEIEVDRLYRLQEIRLSCIMISPLRSLRDKEQEKKMKKDQLKVPKMENEDG